LNNFDEGIVGGLARPFVGDSACCWAPRYVGSWHIAAQIDGRPDVGFSRLNRTGVLLTFPFILPAAAALPGSLDSSP
jgi:hypothetical protein